MHRVGVVGDRERVAAFVKRELGCDAARVLRLDAFVTNAVYEVEAGELRLIVKASWIHEALRAEAWACARAADARCGAPAVLSFGRLEGDDGMSAFIMNRVSGVPIATGRPAFREVGEALRRLHAPRLAGFGSLAEASWGERGEVSLRHGSWLGFLKGICSDARVLPGDPAAVVAAATAAVDARADALAAVEVGSLLHGDLKPAHILVDADRLAGVIDWGDAAVGDPIWDIARFAHRADARSLAMMIEGYDPDRALAAELEWRLPLYGTLWTLVDAVVDQRLGLRESSPPP